MSSGVDGSEVTTCVLMGLLVIVGECTLLSLLTEVEKFLDRTNGLGTEEVELDWFKSAGDLESNAVRELGPGKVFCCQKGKGR